MEGLLAHGWPGNVRELKNAAERSFYRWIAAGRSGPVDEISIDPFGVAPPPAAEPAVAPTKTPPRRQFDLRKELDAIERRWVEETMAACGGNQKEAAARLQLTYDQIRGLVRKHRVSGFQSKRSP
jgi:psp operon transcriptional activator